jgi:hypothetical protein
MRDSDAHLLKPGSIVQIDPADRWALDNMCAGELAIVTEVQSWGVMAFLAKAPHGGAFRFVFHMVEPTGGTIIWDRLGKRAGTPSAPQRHHP